MRNAGKPKLGLVRKSLSTIQPSPENDQIYRPINENDPEIRQLAKSVQANGLLEPIVVTRDGFIVSGHRRFAAAKLAGVKTVKCRVLNRNRAGNTDWFISQLREHNRQREKSIAEKLREELVSSNPDEAHRVLTDYREEQSSIKADTVQIRGQKHRSRITAAKHPFLNAIKDVLRDRRAFLPLTVRAVHYALLNNPPLKHASKRDSIYCNDVSSYKSLVELLTRARICGEIPMEYIRDETRPVSTWRVYPTPTPFIHDELEGFLKGYYRNLMQSQPMHIEIVGEKNTVDPILKAVAGEYCIPMTTGRGYSSLPPRAGMAERFFDSGKETLVVIAVSDFDPDGEEICQSFGRSMRDDFDIDDIELIKAALTHKQVMEMDLPVSMDAKPGSANYDKFVDSYGTDAYELEALDPETLQSLLRESIDGVIDVDLFNAEVDEEKSDAAKLDVIRRSVHDHLKEVDFDDGLTE